MEGIALTDLSGRIILSTHFASPSSLRQAIDAAIASDKAVTWVPGTTAVGLVHGLADVTDEADEVEGEVWAKGGMGAPAGRAVCQVERNGVTYLAPLNKDADPLVPLTFLTELYAVLVNYISGPVTEASLKDHFDVVLALLQEMVASGRPQLSQASQLRDLVLPPSELLTKVALNAASVAGLAVPSQTAANALLTSPLPWRRQGVKYSSNEIYLDLTETLSFLLDASGKPVTGSISGEMACRSRLSGMPDLSLTFVDPSILEESAAFHSSVRYNRWSKDKVVSFVPPDGAFPLLSFVHTPPKTTPALALALLPFSITSSITLGTAGGAFTITLTSRAPSPRPLTNIVIRLPLATGANGLTAQTQGGAYLRDEEGRSMGGGAGQWDVQVEPPREGGEGEKQWLVWTIGQLVSTDRPAVLSGQYYCAPNARKPPSFTLTFDSPSAGFSGLRVNALKVLNESYGVYKGVKMKGKGVVEVRTG
ncbi:hypothetical protein JCM11641_008069 [Rhodosporidiobolus odoratus]